MIVSNTIFIKANIRNIKDLRQRHNDDISLGDIIEDSIEFLQKGSHQKIEVECEICHKRKFLMYQKYIKNVKKHGIYSCSSKCSQEKVKKTSIEKYGVNHYTQTKEYKDRISVTNLEKYGVDHHLKSEEVKRKMELTNMERYGSVNVFSSNKIKNKIHKTNLEKYGSTNPSKNEDVISKIKEKLKESWKSRAIDYYAKKDIEILSINENGTYTISCENHTFEIRKGLLQNRLQIGTTLCTKCFPPNSYTISGLEIQLRKFIESIYDKEINYGNRSILYPKEIDIFLPEINIAIEFNGIYWHCEMEKEKNYHLIKHQNCKSKGIELIQIWQDDWIYKQDIIKSIIKNKISRSDQIYARKCKLKPISNKESIEFLSNNHLQGPINAKINIGLYHNTELVSIMCFGNLRKSLGSKSEKSKYELLRYCNKLNTSIIGGGSKMISYFINNYEFSELITYYDKSFGYKNIYERIGFSYIMDTDPNYHYVIDGIRKHRYEYRKSNLIRMGYDSTKTEKQIMLELKNYRIYGPGNMKYHIIHQE